MEYFNRDVSEMMNMVQPQHLSEEHIQHIMYNLLCSINFLHSFGVVHRDIKPGNILVNDACQVKLCDFGLARSLKVPETKKETNGNIQTNGSTMDGPSPGSMPIVKTSSTSIFSSSDQESSTKSDGRLKLSL